MFHLTSNSRARNCSVVSAHGQLDKFVRTNEPSRRDAMKTTAVLIVSASGGIGSGSDPGEKNDKYEEARGTAFGADL